MVCVGRVRVLSVILIIIGPLIPLICNTRNVTFLAAANKTIMSDTSKAECPSTTTASIVVATRIHLGNASSPPPQQQLDTTILKFLTFATYGCRARSASIAVDATPKFENYDLVVAVQKACDKAAAAAELSEEESISIRVVPVTPWGKFVPALNALVSNAAAVKAEWILFCSAETDAPASSIQTLYKHAFGSVDDADTTIDKRETLVAGALLPGHNYYPNENNGVILDGRTTPWNTLAIWSVPKLSLTGFALVSEGLHPKPDGSEGAAGVEEVAAIALLQRVLGPTNAIAKLVKLPGVQWDQEFEDEERKKWHEFKMKSKVERPARQLQLLSDLTGWVYHY